ncbi:alpha/beta-hydrolase [Parathielavia appendiculata]|uniref:Alpha/beta-hydrolase n=1 Tax=Parathielavia appendiculata TaxID=2587402 RepID=A0AAN6TV08_9PEZI|nr:alpha/beta-hydrolase [Parathielavia appendiculata]
MSLDSNLGIPDARRNNVAADLEARFDRIDVAYKTVNNTPIEAAIFVPKTLSPEAGPKPVPVLVHFHGGALIVGANPDPFFLTDWIRDLAYTTPAIFISVAYRLVPESRAVDSLEDAADFWAWLHAHLSATVQSHWPHLIPNLDRVAVAGESAGGFLAIQSALLFNRTAKLRAVIAQYPALHTDLTTSTDKGVRPVNDDPKLRAVVDGYLQSIKPGSVRVSTPLPTLGAFLGAVLQRGWPTLYEMFGEDDEGRLTLRRALAEAEEVPPPMWVLQGTEDSIIDTPRVDEMVEKIRSQRPRAVVKYTKRPGDHGFDIGSRLEEDWAKEGVEFIKGYWLGAQ